jgi:hypothetical protein
LKQGIGKSGKRKTINQDYYIMFAAFGMRDVFFVKNYRNSEDHPHQDLSEARWGDAVLRV